MKRELSAEFKKKSIEGSRNILYARLKNNSKEMEEFVLRYRALVKIISTIIRNTQFSKEHIELFDKSRRIARPNMSGVRILGEDFGLPEVMDYNVNISRHDFEEYGQVFPPLDPNNKAYWSSVVLGPDKIKNKDDQEKIRLALLAHGESYKKLNNFLSEYLIGSRTSTFLKKQIPAPLTMGKLYDYNEDWFNIFVKESAYPEEKIYKQDNDEEERQEDNSKPQFAAKLDKLREILES